MTQKSDEDVLALTNRYLTLTYPESSARWRRENRWVNSLRRRRLRPWRPRLRPPSPVEGSCSPSLRDTSNREGSCSYRIARSWPSGPHRLCPPCCCRRATGAGRQRERRWLWPARASWTFWREINDQTICETLRSPSHTGSSFARTRLHPRKPPRGGGGTLGEHTL